MHQARIGTLTIAKVAASALVVLALFLLALGPRPKVENGKHGLERKARADILRLQQALKLYRQEQGCLPPDRPGLLGVEGFAHQWKNTTPELLSNVLLIQFLTFRDSREAFIDLKKHQLTRVGVLTHKVANSYLLPHNTDEVPAYACLDPWGNPYVYDNNEGDFASSQMPAGTEKLAGPPNYNPDFDLLSFGVDGVPNDDIGNFGAGKNKGRLRER